MRITRTGSVITLVMSAMMALTTRGGSDRTSSGASGGGAATGAENKVVLISRQDPGTLGYTTSLQTVLLNRVPGNVVGPLLTMDDRGEIGSRLADIKMNDAHTEYTFTLRGNEFSDGSPITAKDVVFSLTKMKKNPIANWAGAFAEVTSIEAIGEEQVKVVLEQPNQTFIRGITSVSGLIQSKVAFGQTTTVPIGSGPYVITEYVQNSRIIFKTSLNCSGKKPTIEKAGIRIISDGAAALDALKSSEADGMPLIRGDMWEQLKSQKLDETMTLLRNLTMGEKQYLVLSADGADTKNPGVCRTFARAIDHEALVAVVSADWATVPICDYGLETDSQMKKTNPNTYLAPEDPVAVAILTGKLRLGSAPSRFVSLSGVPDLSLPANVLTEQFKAAGVTVDREATDLARYSQTIFQGHPPQFEVTNMSDPAGITQFTCPSPQSAGWTTYCPSELNDLIVQVGMVCDAVGHDEPLSQMNEILKKDIVTVLLAYIYGIGLAKPNLKSAGAPSVVFQEIPVYEMS